MKEWGTGEAKEASEALQLSPLKTFSPRSRLQTVDDGGLEESKPGTGAHESIWVVVTPIRDCQARGCVTLLFLNKSGPAVRTAYP